jgi:hypothetical protein
MPGCTHVGSRLHYYHGWSLHEPVLKFGYDDYPRLLESTGQAPNYQNPPNTVPTSHPKSLFCTLAGKQGTSIPGDNMDENKVLVCYPNPYQILVGLSSSTQNTLIILLYSVTKE